jgi:hypothetical protein
MSFERFAANARELSRPHYLWRLPLLEATRAILDGRLDDADAAGRAALALAEQHQAFAGVMAWSLHRISLAMAHDAPARIASDAPKLLHAFRRSSSFAAWVHAALGNRSEALSLLAHGPFHRATLAPTIFAGSIACMLGDRDLGENVFEVLAENSQEHEVFWGAPAFGTVIGPTARIAGDVAALLGRTDDAVRLHDQAIAIAERMAAPVLLALACKRRGHVGVPAPMPSTAGTSVASLAHAGEAWSLVFEGRTHVLKARRGLEHLARLLAEPGRETHVLELAGSEVASERGQAVLDTRAKTAYRARIEQLRGKVDETEARGDHLGAERARAEIETIAHELARFLGIGGRDRTAASAADRARAAVTMAVRRAIEAIAELEPTLGAHLAHAVKTGTFCAYRPDPRARLAWRIDL